MNIDVTIPTRRYILDIIVERGAGLDVYKGAVVACVMGPGIKNKIRTYLTMTNDLFHLKE